MTTEQAGATPEASTSTELAIIQGALEEFDAVAAGMEELRAKYKDLVFEKIDTAAGMKVAVAARAVIREPRLAVEKRRKEAKAPLLVLGRKLDSQARELTEALLELESPIDAQIKAEDDRKEAVKRAAAEAESRRIQAIHERIGEIRGLLTDAAGKTSAQILAIADELANSAPAEATFQEFLVNATAAVLETEKALRKLAAETLAREEEAAENERMRADLAALRAVEEVRERERAAEEQRRQDRLAEEEAARRVQQQAEDEARAQARAEEEARLEAQRAEIARQQAEVEAQQRAAREEEERRQEQVRAEEARQRLGLEEAAHRDNDLWNAERFQLEAEAHAENDRRDLESLYPYSKVPGRALIESMGLNYVDTESMVRRLADHVAPLLVRAERFIAGFEGDEMQEGVDDLLADLRAVLPQAEEVAA